MPLGYDCVTISNLSMLLINVIEALKIETKCLVVRKYNHKHALIHHRLVHIYTCINHKE